MFVKITGKFLMTVLVAAVNNTVDFVQAIWPSVSLYASYLWMHIQHGATIAYTYIGGLIA
jgi:hypothetical protein